MQDNTVKIKKGLRNTLETSVSEDDASGKPMRSGGDVDGQSDTSELPVAWTSLSYLNCISNTFTLKEYRRRGLGRAVTLALAARVLHDDDRVSAFIDYDNDTSIKFHEQMGFTRECDFGGQIYSVIGQWISGRSRKVVSGGSVSSGVRLEVPLAMMTGLREATAEDLPGLLERLASCLPYSFTVHGVVKVQLQYNPDSGKQVLVGPASSSLVLITPMCSGMEIQSLSVFWDVDHDDDQTVAQLLGSSPHLDWAKPVYLYAVPMHLLLKVEQMLISGELGNGRLMANPTLKAHLYTITALGLPTTPRLPKEFQLAAIKEHHAEHLHKHWKYRESITLETYKRMLRTLPAVGVFTTTTAPDITTTDETLQDKTQKSINIGKTMQDTLACTVNSKKGIGNTLETTVTEDVSGDTRSSGDVDGQSDTSDLPVAWTSLSYLNCIINTFTLKKYRRRGLGRAVTLALAARVLHDDDRVSAFIVSDNDTSIKFHEQLGFTRECDFGWQRYSILKEADT